MAEYSRRFGSNYPERVMELHEFSDLTTEMRLIADQYSAAYQRGDLESVNLLLAQHPELKKCLITSNTLNLFDEERYNTQIYAKEIMQIIDNSPDEPIKPRDQYVWIGGTV